MGMGLTAEEVHRKYEVSARGSGSRSAYRSHQNALKAQAEGKFDDEIVPVEVEITTLLTRRASRIDTTGNQCSRKTKARARIRRSKRSAKLKPVFHAHGTVTAGNSSQTSDGAAAAIVMSEKKARKNWD